MNNTLHSSSGLWTSQLASLVAAIVLICVCFVFEIIVFVLPVRKKGEKASLLARQRSQRSLVQSVNASSSAISLASTSDVRKSSAMMSEGALYEPWNQATLDKLSAEDSPPATKITRALYRYGPIAGKIMLRRFGHSLAPQETAEIERILNFGQEKEKG